jgi:hypothetical protein
MLKRIGQLAEQMAVSVSRRSFLSRIAKGALALAGAMGIATSSENATAAGGGKRCCWYYHARINAYTTQCVNFRDACPGYPVYQEIVQGCRQCRVENI